MQKKLDKSTNTSAFQVWKYDNHGITADITKCFRKHRIQKWDQPASN